MSDPYLYWPGGSDFRIRKSERNQAFVALKHLVQAPGFVYPELPVKAKKATDKRLEGILHNTNWRTFNEPDTGSLIGLGMLYGGTKLHPVYCQVIETLAPFVMEGSWVQMHKRLSEPIPGLLDIDNDYWVFDGETLRIQKEQPTDAPIHFNYQPLRHWNNLPDPLPENYRFGNNWELNNDEDDEEEDDEDWA